MKAEIKMEKLEMKIIDNNKIIAEFMGVTPRKISKNLYSYTDSVFFMTTGTKIEVLNRIAEYAKYHTSWDWLMPVIEKISKTKKEYKEPNEGMFYDNYPRTFGMVNEDNGHYMFRFNMHTLFQAETLIEAAYLAVVDWIKREQDETN